MGVWLIVIVFVIAIVIDLFPITTTITMAIATKTAEKSPLTSAESHVTLSYVRLMKRMNMFIPNTYWNLGAVAAEAFMRRSDP